MKKWYCPGVLTFVGVLVFAACAGATPAPTATPEVKAPPVRTLTPLPKKEVRATPKREVAATPRPKTQAPANSTPYYQGKTIELLVGSSAGGGTDTIARFTAAYMPKYIPGNPRFVVRNMPSAQGVTAANAFYQKTQQDGLTLLQDSSGTISLQLMREPIVKYDLRKFRSIGHIARAESVLMIRQGRMGRLTDRRGEAVVNATRAGGETWQALPLWGNEFLGWNVRWLPGFTGSSEMELAFRRGEIDMFGTANAYIVRRLAEEGVGEPVTQIGGIKGGKFMRRPDFADVPTLEELLGDKKPAGISWQSYLAWVGPGLIDKNLAAPQGTPDNIMKILIDAFTRMTQDAGFVEKVKKTVSEVYDVGIGKETEAMMKEILDAPVEAIAYSKGLQSKYKILAK